MSLYIGFWSLWSLIVVVSDHIHMKDPLNSNPSQLTRVVVGNIVMKVDIWTWWNKTKINLKRRLILLSKIPPLLERGVNGSIEYFSVFKNYLHRQSQLLQTIYSVQKLSQIVENFLESNFIYLDGFIIAARIKAHMPYKCLQIFIKRRKIGKICEKRGGDLSTF